MEQEINQIIYSIKEDRNLFSSFLFVYLMLWDQIVQNNFL